jgi:small GTP-binding protein
MGCRNISSRDNDKEYRLEIWDTAGQESYLAITRSYYRGADGCLLVYDITNRASFEALPMWLSEAKQNSQNPNLVVIMIGNKADLQNREVSFDEADVFAQVNLLCLLALSTYFKFCT